MTPLIPTDKGLCSDWAPGGGSFLVFPRPSRILNDLERSSLYGPCSAREVIASFLLEWYFTGERRVPFIKAPLERNRTTLSSSFFFDFLPSGALFFPPEVKEVLFPLRPKMRSSRITSFQGSPWMIDPLRDAFSPPLELIPLGGLYFSFSCESLKKVRSFFRKY